MAIRKTSIWISKADYQPIHQIVAERMELEWWDNGETVELKGEPDMINFYIDHFDGRLNFTRFNTGAPAAATQFTNLEAKRDAMRVGTDRLLATLGLTRNDFAGMGDADTLFALSTTFQKQGCINASLTTLKLANTARELETVTPESLDGFFAAHNVRISAERQVNPAAQALAASWVEPTLASDIAEMMKGWNEIEATAKAQFPNATSEEIYQIAAGAMNHTLGLRAA